MANDLTKALFDEINAHLAEQGLLMRAGRLHSPAVRTNDGRRR